MISLDVNATWQQIIWQPVIEGKTHDVAIDVLAANDGADVHLYAGLGEERRATEAGITALASVGVNAVGVVLPFHILEATRANIERTCNEAPIAVARQLNEQAKKPVERPVHLIGKSQGGGVVLLTGRAAPEVYGAIGALAPVGLNRDFLGKNSDHKRRMFLRRLLVNNNLKRDQNPFVDKGNWRAAIEVGSRAVSDVAGRRLKAKVDFAMEHDFAADIHRLQRDHPIRIFVGETDPLFKAAELAQTLGSVGCESLLEVIDGSHCSLLTRKGSAQLEAVGAWINSVK